MTEETTLYSGELSGDAYETFDEVAEGIHPWMGAYVDVILESNGEDQLRVEGPDTRSILRPWKTYRESTTYDLDPETAEYLRQAFEDPLESLFRAIGED